MSSVGTTGYVGPFKSPNDVHGECLCDAGGHILRRRTRSWRGSSALGPEFTHDREDYRCSHLPLFFMWVDRPGGTGADGDEGRLVALRSLGFPPWEVVLHRISITSFWQQRSPASGRPPSRPWPTFAAGTSFNVFLRLFSSAILTSSLSSKPLVACVTEEGEMTHEDAPWRKSQRVMLATASPMNSSHHDEELVGSSFPFTGCTWTCSDMHGDQNRKRKKAMISDGGPIGWGH